MVQVGTPQSHPQKPLAVGLFKPEDRRCASVVANIYKEWLRRRHGMSWSQMGKIAVEPLRLFLEQRVDKKALVGVLFLQAL